MGPSSDPTIWPEFEMLGKFTGNVAHSNGRYGLRIFHKLDPHADPILKTKSIPGIFEDYTGFKNKRNGAIFEDVGTIVCKDFKVADNILAGIEYSLMRHKLDEGVSAHIINAVVVGHTDNWEATNSETNFGYADLKA
jgi:hypothetical protein